MKELTSIADFLYQFKFEPDYCKRLLIYSYIQSTGHYTGATYEIALKWLMDWADRNKNLNIGCMAMVNFLNKNREYIPIYPKPLISPTAINTFTNTKDITRYQQITVDRENIQNWLDRELENKISRYMTEHPELTRDQATTRVINHILPYNND